MQIPTIPTSTTIPAASQGSQTPRTPPPGPSSTPTTSQARARSWCAPRAAPSATTTTRAGLLRAWPRAARAGWCTPMITPGRERACSTGTPPTPSTSTTARGWCTFALATPSLRCTSHSHPSYRQSVSLSISRSVNLGASVVTPALVHRHDSGLLVILTGVMLFVSCEAGDKVHQTFAHQKSLPALQQPFPLQGRRTMAVGTPDVAPIYFGPDESQNLPVSARK